MKPIRNAIVFVGNTRVGKSYICNRILKYCNSSRTFVSTSSNMSVTSALQQEIINYQGKSYTIVDSPGFFDTSSCKGDNVDGVNMCKLVRVLESCEEIFAIIFVFTDGFSTPHKIWFDRMVQLVSTANRGHILLLRNKEGDSTPDELAENRAEINQILGGGVKQPYFGFEFKASDEVVKSLLNTLTQMVHFQLNNLVIPEICYEKTEESREFEELIFDPTTKDEGYMVKERKDTSHYETHKEAMDGIPGLLGFKQTVREWVKSEAVEEIWVENKVTRRTIGTFVNVFQDDSIKCMKVRRFSPSVLFINSFLVPYHFNSPNMSFTKSGEILRMGSGNYCFLCIHCGFNFFNLKEILAHIDDHFDRMDVNNPETTNTEESRKISEFTGLPLQQICEREMVFDGDLCADIKIEENVEEIRSEIIINEISGEISEEIRSRIKIDVDEEATVSHKTKRKKTRPKVAKSRSTKTKSKTKLGTVSFVDNQQCSLCDSNFNNLVNYQSHLRVTHGIDKIFQCYICGLYFKSFNLLQRHLSSLFHSKSNCYQCELDPPITNELVARPHKCFLCKEWFQNHILFRKHFKNIHDQDVATFFRKKSNCNEYSCYICKKDFLHKYYLKNHMVIHNEIKPYVCDVCGKSYRTKAILGRHLNVHEGKTYACEDCGKTFPYYARLRIHRYSHRTELKHVCTVCSKAFKVQKYLARHMKLHRDEKAFACRYCDKRFTFSTGRRAHEISQHNAV